MGDHWIKQVASRWWELEGVPGMFDGSRAIIATVGTDVVRVFGPDYMTGHGLGHLVGFAHETEEHAVDCAYGDVTDAQECGWRVVSDWQTAQVAG